MAESNLCELRGKKLTCTRRQQGKDAGNYITKLPKAEHGVQEWQAAMEALILVAIHQYRPHSCFVGMQHEVAIRPRGHAAAAKIDRFIAYSCFQVRCDGTSFPRAEYAVSNVRQSPARHRVSVIQRSSPGRRCRKLVSNVSKPSRAEN